MPLTDLRMPGHERYEPIERFLGREFRLRLLNPESIKGMQGEGYAGACEVRKGAEYLWRWHVDYASFRFVRPPGNKLKSSDFRPAKR